MFNMMWLFVSSSKSHVLSNVYFITIWLILTRNIFHQIPTAFKVNVWSITTQIMFYSLGISFFSSSFVLQHHLARLVLPPSLLDLSCSSCNGWCWKGGQRQEALMTQNLFEDWKVFPLTFLIPCISQCQGSCLYLILDVNPLMAIQHSLQYSLYNAS